MSRHRLRPQRSPICRAKTRLANLDQQIRKTADPATRRQLRRERAWLAFNAATQSHH